MIDKTRSFRIPWPALGVSCALVLTACPEKKDEPAKVEVDAGTAALSGPPKQPYAAITRLEFNARAQERFLPLFWRADADQNGALEPAELVTLVGPWPLKREDLV